MTSRTVTISDDGDQYQVTYRDDMTVQLTQHMGNDKMVVAAARVSTNEDIQAYIASNPDDEPGLINFLMKNRHGTPFEHAGMTFFVQAPIFVFREWHRHRVGWSYNEESARYKNMKPVFYIPNEERNLQQVGKPGQYTFEPGTGYQKLNLKSNAEGAYIHAYEAYCNMLDAGIAREVARIVLPVGLYSSMWATCNPRSLMHFLSLRTKDPASKFPSFPQREIEMAAQQMEEQFATLFPITHAAFVKNGRVAP